MVPAVVLPIRFFFIQTAPFFLVLQNASLECKLKESERASVEAALASEEAIRLLDEEIEELKRQVYLIVLLVAFMHWPFLALRS